MGSIVYRDRTWKETWNYDWQWAKLLKTYTYGFEESKWNYGSRQKNFYMSWLWVFQLVVQVIGQNTLNMALYNLVPVQNEGHWNYWKSSETSHKTG